MGFRSEKDGSRVALVALGSEVVRCGLRTMLRELGAVDDVIESDNLDQSIELLDSGRPTLLILSSGDQPHQAEKLARTATDLGVRVLLVLRAASDQTLAAVAAIPADGYLLEHALTREALLSALSDLESGLVPMPGPVARTLIAQISPAPRPRRDPPVAVRPGDPRSVPLSCREMEALKLMVEGLSNKQIARRLGISEHGAKRHVANILAKLNCPNRTLAAATAISRGLVPDPGSARRVRTR
ncbi:DNA-binding response regulator [Planobispora rosea]|uniref:DNA-binding response regulator n=1 Tax=Planobispora rosea TaxID=35762 RepID=A0A8J3WBG9_PLARO|nr:response regulator transcription factor [Planobispora rosea]GGS61130.1 DNA-binding response regulator [Planobispora rosea]GIH83914.1 DNA-binding response regulator [Planobispora rosea]